MSAPDRQVVIALQARMDAQEAAARLYGSAHRLELMADRAELAGDDRRCAALRSMVRRTRQRAAAMLPRATRATP